MDAPAEDSKSGLPAGDALLSDGPAVHPSLLAGGQSDTTRLFADIEALLASNAELRAVNARHQNKIDELTQLTNDMDNLLRFTDMGAAFLDTRLRIRKITPSITSSFFLTPDDLGRPIELVASKLEHPTLMDDLREVLEVHNPLEREVRNHAGAWLLMRALPYRTETGAIEGVVLTFTDITAIRRARQELSQSEANFRELANFVNAIFWLTSPDGSAIIYVSPGYEKLWKRSLGSLREQPHSWLDALHPADRERLSLSFSTRNRERDWEEHYRIVWPDGSVRWIRDRRYPVRDQHGEVIRLAGISVDITQSRKSQEQLELTQFAVDNAGDMVFWLRPDGTVLYANLSATRVLGYGHDQLLKMHLSDIDTQRPFDDWTGYLGRLEQESFLTQDSLYRTHAGDLVPVEVSSTCLRFDDATYCCSIARDVSQRRRAERELSHYASALERANESLRHHNRELDEFAYLASHDLKEPLRAISTFSELLAQDLGGDLPTDAIRDLEFITNASARMQRLITDLLALSRAGRADMQSGQVNLRRCVDSALEALAVRRQETGAHITIGELPEVTGDQTMITQLFQNLLSNALKFTGDDPPEIEVSAQHSDVGWVFQVSDNGIGIKPEYAEKIFQPFRRVHVQIGREGTGIGLAICRKVVERHGGRIWVESSPGQGASFRFTLDESRDSVCCS